MTGSPLCLSSSTNPMIQSACMIPARQHQGSMVVGSCHAALTPAAVCAGLEFPQASTQVRPSSTVHRKTAYIRRHGAVGCPKNGMHSDQDRPMHGRTVTDEPYGDHQRILPGTYPRIVSNILIQSSRPHPNCRNTPRGGSTMARRTEQHVRVVPIVSI